MVLPAPELDDRRFQDLVDEAKRLIPQYCPEWTNHNLSDPGVALIELFAWMSEMVLYRLNKVPDRYYTKFLELVGISPFPPAVARTHLTFWLSAELDEPVFVPAGVMVATQAPVAGAEVVFSTRTGLVIAPPELTAAATTLAGQDAQYTPVLDELIYPGGVVTCFGSMRPELPDGPTRRAAVAGDERDATGMPGDAFYLGFKDSLAGNIIRLDIEALVEGVGVDPDNPPLVWELGTGKAWIEAEVHEDTTGGLNRNGHVILVLPLHHEPITLGGTRAFWLRVRLTECAPEQPAYEASPRVRSIAARALGGTVAAEHAESVGRESLGRSDGSVGQSFAVRRPPVLPRDEGEHVYLVTNDGEEHWTEVDDFTASLRTDRHYTFDGATGTIRFGPRVRYADGSIRQHGAVPADGAEIVVTGYRHGGGDAGNVGRGKLNRLRTTVPFIDRVENLHHSFGGVDAETVENAKIRGPMTLRTGQRAVTSDDFERLCLESSAAVARARCLPPEIPGGPVRMLVVPDLADSKARPELDDFALSADLLATVSQHLDERRVLGTAIEVSTPFYQGITVAVLVQSQSGRPASLVRERVLTELNRYINPLTGGGDGQGWPFAQDANAAHIAQLLEAVEGVERIEEVLLFEFDLRTGKRQGPGREVVRLDNHSLFISAGHQVVCR